MSKSRNYYGIILAKLGSADGSWYDYEYQEVKQNSTH